MIADELATKKVGSGISPIKISVSVNIKQDSISKARPLELIKDSYTAGEENLERIIDKARRRLVQRDERELQKLR